MKRSRRLALIVLSVLPMLLTLLLFPLFPQEVPMGGGWENKYVQLVLPAALMVLGLGGLLVHNRLQKVHRDGAAAMLDRLLLYFLAVGLVLYIVLTLSSYWNITLSAFTNMQEQSFDLMQVVFLIINVAAMVAGNRLPSRPFGDALAIRTRCALQDREIWRKTHSLCGPLYVFAGILGLVLCAFLEGWLLAGLCLVLLLIPMVVGILYSHRLWDVKFR